MQFWTGVDFKETFKKIRQLDTAAQYSAFVKFLDLTRPYFIRCTSQSQKKYFFWVRRTGPCGERIPTTYLTNTTMWVTLQRTAEFRSTRTQFV